MLYDLPFRSVLTILGVKIRTIRSTPLIFMALTVLSPTLAVCYSLKLLLVTYSFADSLRRYDFGCQPRRNRLPYILIRFIHEGRPAYGDRPATFP